MRLVPISGPVASFTGSTTAASAVVASVSDASRLIPGQVVRGPGIPFGTRILSVDSAAQVTLTAPATATAAGVAITAAVEPVTLAEAKNHVRQGDITVDDALIASLVAAARLYCEAKLKQSLITQRWAVYLDSFPTAGGYYNRAVRDVWAGLGGLPSGLGAYPGMLPGAGGEIALPRPPVQAVELVQYVDFAGTLRTIDPSLYGVGLGDAGARIQPAYGTVWPLARPTLDSVKITLRCGYGDTPADVPDTVRAAVLLLVGHWYSNREAVAEGAFADVPRSVDALLGTAEHGSYG